MDINNEFRKFTSKHLTDFDKQLDKDIEWDLLITGDDAIELLNDYGKMFNVKVEIVFDQYFHDEARYWVLLFRRLIKRRVKKKLTFRVLLKGIEKGILDDNCTVGDVR